MFPGRCARAIITYDKEDISEAIQQSLKSITVTLTGDSESADDVTIEMHDRDLMWIGPWYPKVKKKESKS